MEGITADRTYHPGDLIYSEEAFAVILCRRDKNEFCENCFTRSTSLKTCKGCLAVKYCNKSCQRKNWSDHRLECKYLKNLPEHKFEDFVRLVGKIILKLKGKDWKTVTWNVLGTEVNMYDIFYSDQVPLREDPYEELHLIETKDFLVSYIGEENLPEDSDLKNILQKVSNRFNHDGVSAKPAILRFFPGLCLLKSECIPNSSLGVAMKRTLKIWAIKKIEKGSEKISVTNTNIFDFDMKMYIPKCRCSVCSLPYGDSVLTSIIDEKRAYNVIIQSEVFLKMIEGIPDINVFPNVEMDVEDLLKRQKGVLGDTHILHLKLLAIKAFEIRKISPLEKLNTLIELERQIRDLFGEYYHEMKPIYKALVAAYACVGNIYKSFTYIEKLYKLEAYTEQSSS